MAEDAGDRLPGSKAPDVATIHYLKSQQPCANTSSQIGQLNSKDCEQLRYVADLSEQMSIIASRIGCANLADKLEAASAQARQLIPVDLTD